MRIHHNKPDHHRFRSTGDASHHGRQQKGQGRLTPKFLALEQEMNTKPQKEWTHRDFLKLINNWLWDQRPRSAFPSDTSQERLLQTAQEHKIGPFASFRPEAQKEESNIDDIGKKEEDKSPLYENQSEQDLESLTCNDCDSFKFLIDNDIKNLYQIAKHYKLDYSELLKLNSHIANPKTMQAGVTIYLPKGTLGTKQEPVAPDSFKFLIDNNIENLWRIAVHYKLDYSELLKLNGHITNPKTMQEGVTIYLPSGTLSKNPKPESNPKSKPVSSDSKSTTSGTEIAGDPKGKKTILIAWSFDDGPHPNTDGLNEKLGSNNSTWFIVKKNMTDNTGGWKKNIERYKKIQDAGGEIGIHAQHDSIDHIVWFPVNDTSDGYKNKGTGKHKTYESIEKSMTDLKTFKGDLNKGGINPKFVRLPGGLKSQIIYYARHFGFSDVNEAANAVIAGKDFKTLGLSDKKLEIGYNRMARDFKILKSGLKDMGLLLWGGSADPNKISNQSWEAESSGSPHLDDNVTNHHNTGRKQTGNFERLAGRMREGETRSLVILAHDTAQSHIDEVLADKKQMEDYASKNSVRIEYLTMTSLFNKITNKNVDEFTPNY